MSSKQHTVTIKMSELMHVPQTISAMRTEIGELRQLVATLMTRVNELEAIRTVAENSKQVFADRESRNEEDERQLSSLIDFFQK